MSEVTVPSVPYGYGYGAGPTRPPDDQGPFAKIACVWDRVLDGETYAFPVNSTSTQLEKARIVKSGEGVLFGITGVSTNVAAQFILVFNTEQTPIQNGAVPVLVISVPAGSNFSWDGGTWGRHFSQGIVLANSSTAATLTAGAADTWFDAQYI